MRMPVDRYMFLIEHPEQRTFFENIGHAWEMYRSEYSKSVKWEAIRFCLIMAWERVKNTAMGAA